MLPPAEQVRAFLQATQGLDAKTQLAERQRYFDAKFSAAWLQLDDADKKEVMKAFGSGLQYPTRGPEATMARTKEALEPFKPGFTASDMTSVLRNPQATLAEKAKAIAGYASMYPDVVTKALAPPAAWREKRSVFDFLPLTEGYNVLGSMGADAARNLGAPEWAGYLGAGLINPATARLFMRRFGGQFTSPVLRQMLERRAAPPPQLITGESTPAATAAAVPPGQPRVRLTPQGPVQLF